MAKFRKKPVVIDAERFTTEAFWKCYDTNSLFMGMFKCCGSYHPGDRTISQAYITIDTLEGQMTANLGDWIIRGIKGEYYPCKSDIFEATYEPAEPVVEERKEE